MLFRFLARLKSSSSHLWWDALLDSIRALVGGVYLVPFRQGVVGQVLSVVHTVGCVLDCFLYFSEVGFVEGDGGKSLGRRCRGLAGGFDDERRLVVVCARNIVDLGVGNSRVLELVQRFDVSLLCAEFDLSGSLGLTVSLLDEAIVALGDFPHQ